MKIHKSPKAILGCLIRLFANLPMPGNVRWRLIKLSGVNIVNPDPSKPLSLFIGTGVHFDSTYPEDITLESKCYITSGCRILTHYVTRNNENNVIFTRGKVKIETQAFIGMNTIIAKPVTIGHHSTVAAGSIVTKDIPPFEIWGGVPAKFIKKIDTNFHV